MLTKRLALTLTAALFLAANLYNPALADDSTPAAVLPDSRPVVGTKLAKPAAPVADNEISPAAPAGRVAVKAAEQFADDVQGSKSWPEYPTRPPSLLIHKIADVLNKFPLIGILFVAMFCDVLVGLLVAFVTKQLSSTISRRGAARKAVTLIIVGLGAAVEPYSGLPIAKAIAGYYILTEIISMLEGAALLGVPVPARLLESLAKLKLQEEALFGNAAAGVKVPAVAVVPAPPVTVVVRPDRADVRANGQTQRIDLSAVVTDANAGEQSSAIRENTAAVEANTAARIASNEAAPK